MKSFFQTFLAKVPFSTLEVLAVAVTGRNPAQSVPASRVGTMGEVPGATEGVPGSTMNARMVRIKRDKLS